MARITLNHVSVNFPVLHTGQRSLKKALVAQATGGAILRDAASAPTVQALRDISAEFLPGDRVGLVGHNGAGKSTLLRVIAGIYEPNHGTVETQGRIVPLLDLGIGFDADLSGRENIRLRGMYLGVPPSRFEAMAPEIAAFTELGEFLDLPVRTYSSGMQMRLALGIATAIEADVLLMDEWVLAGDAAFLEKARARMARFVESARILVLASHSEAIIREWCNKAILMKGGEMLASGAVDEVFREYARQSGTASTAAHPGSGA
ncbi:ABC transporter ATP-binding protein [Rhodopseudomonas palustris]|nr:ABC transporter ATP-binding protein [Rhodopseudomonas palustris]